MCNFPRVSRDSGTRGAFLRFQRWAIISRPVGLKVIRAHNDSLQAGAEKVGFYGLDLYSLHGSIDAILAYLNKVDPTSARRARHRYACFDHFGKDTQTHKWLRLLSISRHPHVFKFDPIAHLKHIVEPVQHIDEADKESQLNQFRIRECSMYPFIVC